MIRVSREDAVRLWLHLQGLSQPRGSRALEPETLTRHLEATGGLQLDSVNVLDRAHYLTLWSRFGAYDHAALDHWVYEERVAVDYWAHEASLMPASHLPLARRRMRRFPPQTWSGRSWWKAYQTPASSKRRVLRRLREEGPLESVAFERSEDKRSLKVLWHSGRIAIHERRHFRILYDLAERVYPEGDAVSLAAYQDSWLARGLRGNGVASQAHLANYITGPSLTAGERDRVLNRALRRRVVLEVELDGFPGRWFVLPEHLELLGSVPPARGTTFICPFDSLLWQRTRAEQLLDFAYRIEIYVPAKKRVFGYYVLPILHDGALVGRVDLKFHRDQGVLEAKSLHLEPSFRSSAAFSRALEETMQDLAGFLGAGAVQTPAL